MTSAPNPWPAHPMNRWVLVPVHSRPECLRVAMETLAANAGLSGWAVCIHVERGSTAYDPQTMEFCLEPIQGRTRLTTIRPNPGPRGLSGNILSAYAFAQAQMADLVLLQEEDVAIAEDALQFAEAAAVLFGQPEQPSMPFGLVLSRNTNDPDDKDRMAIHRRQDDLVALSSRPDYRSIAPVLPRGTIDEVLGPGAQRVASQDRVPALFRDRFPDSRFPPGQWTEQAGWIRRLHEASGLPLAWPTRPRAFHFGYYGKNRRQSWLRGTLANKAGVLRNLVHHGTREQIRGLTGGKADSDQEDLSAGNWTRLHTHHTP